MLRRKYLKILICLAGFIIWETGVFAQQALQRGLSPAGYPYTVTGTVNPVWPRDTINKVSRFFKGTIVPSLFNDPYGLRFYAASGYPSLPAGTPSSSLMKRPRFLQTPGLYVYDQYKGPFLVKYISFYPVLPAHFPGVFALSPAPSAAYPGGGYLLASNVPGIKNTGINPGGLPSLNNALSVPGGWGGSLPANNLLNTNLPKSGALGAGSLPLTGAGGSGTAPNLVINNVNGDKNQLANTPARFANVRAALTGQALTGYKGINDAISQNFKSIPKASFAANLAIANDVQYNPVALNPGGPKFLDVAGITGTVMVLGVPLNINISNNRASFNGQNPFSAGLFRIGFNPLPGTGLGISPMQQYQQLRNTAFQGFGFTNYVRQTVSNHVTSLQTGAAAGESSPFSKQLKSPDSLQALVMLNQTQLHSKLDSLAVNDKNAHPADTSAKSVADANAVKQANLKRADSLTQVITSIKSQMTANGLDPSKVIQQDNYAKGSTSSSFNSSEAAAALNQKNPENALQSVFSGLKGLRIGSFGTTIPGATDGQGSQLLTGADVRFKMANYPLDAGFGTLSDMNAIKDQNYTASDYTYPKTITYLGVDMPKTAFGKVNVAFVSSFSSELNNIQYGIPTLPGNVVDFTITKAMDFHNFGHISVDVSKSNTLQNSSFMPGSDAVILKKAGADYNLSNNLFQSFSFGFRHDLDIMALGASDNVYFSYSGLGYQNPANSGYSGGSVKAGGDLKKSYYKNKLVFDLISDYDSTPMSYTANQKFLTLLAQLSCKYKVNKDMNMSIKYMTNSTSEQIGSVSNSVYSSDKIEFGENNNYKIAGHQASTNITIAYQSFMQNDSVATTSNQLNFTYVESVAFKTSSLSFTFFYNMEMTASPLLGDMTLADATYQYQVCRKLQLSSGMTYLNNAGYAKQAGIKQTIQLIAKKHFDISASFDWMKNLITPVYADLYPSFRGELNLKYYLKLE